MSSNSAPFPPERPVLADRADPNVEAVRAMLLARSAVGLAKYGVTTEALSAPAALRHALEEACDLAVYLTAALADVERMAPVIAAALEWRASVDDGAAPGFDEYEAVLDRLLAAVDAYNRSLPEPAR